MVEGKPASALVRYARLGLESSRLSCTAGAQAAAGHETLAKEALDLLARKYPPSMPDDVEDMAEIHALLGENDRAFEWLDRLATFHGESVALVKINPLLRKLHGDPRWPALLRIGSSPTCSSSTRLSSPARISTTTTRLTPSRRSRLR